MNKNILCLILMFGCMILDILYFILLVHSKFIERIFRKLGEKFDGHLSLTRNIFGARYFCPSSFGTFLFVLATLFALLFIEGFSMYFILF